MNVKILGYEVEIREQKNLRLEHGAIGQSGQSSLWLSVDPSLPKDMQRSTLIHEIIEQLNYHLEMKLEHPQITQLESGLYQVIKDNPHLFTFDFANHD